MTPLTVTRDQAPLFDLEPRWNPVDQTTQSVLALMDCDPIHRADRARVIAAIVRVALADPGRIVDLNKLRTELVNAVGGEYDVYPATVGSTVLGMKRRGLLTDTGYTNRTEGSPHGNDGKPQRLYRLAALPEPEGVTP